MLRKFGVSTETGFGERLGERRLRRLGAWLVLHALHGTPFPELADDQGPESVIGVGDSPAAHVPGFGERTSREGTDNAGKDLDHWLIPCYPLRYYPATEHTTTGSLAPGTLPA